MRKKIVIDIDGVLADTWNEFIEWYNNKYSASLKFENYYELESEKLFGKSFEDIQNLVKEYANEEPFKTVNLVEDAFRGIEELSKLGDLYVVTSRPLQMKEATVQWLNDKFKDKLKKVIFAKSWQRTFDDEGEKTKAEICKELGADLIIDDDLGYALPCAKSGIKVFLFGKRKENNFHENILVTQSWNEVISNLKNLN